MILKIIGIVSYIVWLHGANGASYSKVYVQSGGSDVVPVEYVNYGAPAVLADPQIARLSAAPIGSVVSSVIPPCVSPCIIPGQNIAPVATVPNAKFITYNAPNVPVVVAPSKDNGYEYSYVVYDENTGDRKAQREFSDGSVVRGEYSFVQPDGYVREVQYRADDLTGFNVVVKKILPDSVGLVDNKKDNLPPCKDVKSEALKEEPKLELAEEAPQDHSDDHSHDDHDPNHEGHDQHHVEHDDNDPSHDHAEPAPEAPSAEEPTHEEVNEAPAEEQAPEPENAPEAETTPKAQEAPEVEKPVDAEQAPEPEKPKEPTPEAPVETQEETHEAIVVPDEPSNEVVVSPLPLPVPVPPIPATNLVISYDDIIRCIQAKAQSQGQNFSPLTYIILPAANRPC